MNSIKSNRKSMAAPKWLGNSLFFVMCLAMALQLMFVVKALAQTDKPDSITFKSYSMAKSYSTYHSHKYPGYNNYLMMYGNPDSIVVTDSLKAINLLLSVIKDMRDRERIKDRMEYTAESLQFKSAADKQKYLRLQKQLDKHNTYKP